MHHSTKCLRERERKKKGSDSEKGSLCTFQVPRYDSSRGLTVFPLRIYETSLNFYSNFPFYFRKNYFQVKILLNNTEGINTCLYIIAFIF